LATIPFFQIYADVLPTNFYPSVGKLKIFMYIYHIFLVRFPRFGHQTVFSGFSTKIQKIQLSRNEIAGFIFPFSEYPNQDRKSCGKQHRKLRPSALFVVETMNFPCRFRH
jgi:hypothetical protein